MFNYKVFSARMRYKRNRRNLTIESLSLLTEISAATLYNYENCSQIVEVEDLVKIADVFEVSLDYLVGR